MRDEFVRRRAWLDDQAFLDLIGAANLIPGPTSTELAMHIGHRRAGRAGLVVAGLAFLLPAVVLVGVLAWVYVQVGRPAQLGALLDGIASVVVAIVAHAGWSIGRTALRGPLQFALLAGAIVAVLLGVSEIAVLLGAGAISLLTRVGSERAPVALAAICWPATGTALAAAATAGSVATPVLIFGVFLKLGAVLFGSGYVLLALLRSELVEGLGWITETQLIDAIAVGHATPGPLFSTATFIGYLVGGPAGAAAATVGVFLPAFVAVALSIPVLDRLRDSTRARAFLDGVNAAAVGLLVVVAAQLSLASVRDVVSFVTAALALVLLVRGVGTGRLIAAGAAVGLIRLLSAPM